MRYALCILALIFALPLQASEFNWSDTNTTTAPAFSWSTTPPTGCTCNLGGPCTCGPECSCGIALTSTDPFTPANRVVESFASIYQRAVSTGKTLVVGVNRVPPSGDWLTAQVPPDDFYRDGQVLVLKPQAGKGLFVAARLGQITAQDVQQVLTPPAPQLTGYSFQAGGCASGSCGVGMPMMGGRTFAGACFGGS